MRGALHIYVYYRIVRDSAATRATVAAIFADVERATGVVGRLLARADDPRTWMEVYEPVTRAAAFERELAAAVHIHQAAALAEGGQRHVERFAALPARRPRR